MELHSPTAAKKLWNLLRIAFLMMRKGLVSKRKLMLDLNVVMQRGKIMGKTLGNLMFNHHSGTTPPRGLPFGLREYEFSCSNSPNPLFFHVNSKRKHSYFPCISATPVDDDKPDKTPGSVAVIPRIEYSPRCMYSPGDLASGERRTPIPSPFSVRVSNYSLAEEGDGSSCEVDNEAEEFIKRFYQQLKAQGRIALLEYQEKEFQEMLTRGT